RGLSRWGVDLALHDRQHEGAGASHPSGHSRQLGPPTRGRRMSGFEVRKKYKHWWAIERGGYSRLGVGDTRDEALFRATGARIRTKQVWDTRTWMLREGVASGADDLVVKVDAETIETVAAIERPVKASGKHVRDRRKISEPSGGWDAQDECWQAS